MIKVEVKKIWLGKVSVRDYVYKKALRQKESLGIVHGKEFMIIPYENLKMYDLPSMSELKKTQPIFCSYFFKWRNFIIKFFN